jgi:hypothetical protein
MYKALIDAYALLGRRMWSVIGPRPYRKPPRHADDARRTV